MIGALDCTDDPPPEDDEADDEEVLLLVAVPLSRGTADPAVSPLDGRDPACASGAVRCPAHAVDRRDCEGRSDQPDCKFRTYHDKLLRNLWQMASLSAALAL